MNYQFSALFFSLLTDIHFIFGTLLGILLYHAKFKPKFEFSFDPLNWYEVMALGLKEILQIVSFCTFVAPPPLDWQ
jgi:hypothetical protein